MQNSKNYFVYILSNQNGKVLYVGVTNNLERRLFEHKQKLVKGFTYKYNVDKLIYFEQTDNVESAIFREKQIKAWARLKKDKLIDGFNPERNDLSEEWYAIPRDSSLHSE